MYENFLNINFDIAYWNDFYKTNGFEIPDWYFNFEKLKPEILKTWNPSSEILIIGAGVSSILDYLVEKKFTYITVLDFSQPLIEYLKKRYSTIPECEEWDCILT